MHYIICTVFFKLIASIPDIVHLSDVEQQVSKIVLAVAEHVHGQGVADGQDREEEKQ